MKRNVIRIASLVLLLLTNAALCEPAETGKSARTGSYRLSLTLTEAAGAQMAGAAENVIAANEEIEWEVYVPDNYQAENPAGLMVYISPSSKAKIPLRWKSIMGKRNMIWVAARHSGNSVKVARRIIYSMAAPTLMAKHYNIDPRRVYLSGLSGGGRVASMVASDYPQLFRGAIYNCGANFWDERAPKHLDLIQQNHYVFITGTRDFARVPTKKAHRQYLQAGVENSKLMVIPGMTHRNPERSDFDEAIGYLDRHIVQQASAVQ